MIKPLDIAHLLFLLLLSASVTSAQEWARYLGKDGRATAQAANIPTEFTVADYNWQIELSGVGHSSPVVWGNQVVMTTVLSDKERAVIGMDTSNGRQLWQWKQPFVGHNRHRFNEHAASTPCIDEKRIYVTWSSGEKEGQVGGDPVPGSAEAIALDHAGKMVWRRDLGHFAGDHGSASSPILVDGVLFLFWDNLIGKTTTFTALNPADGSDVWRKELPWGKDAKSTYSTPAIYTNSKGGTEVIVSSMPFGVLSLNPKNGKELWRYDHEHKARTVGSPVVSEGVIFATWGSGNGAKDHIAITPGTETADGKPKVAWRRPDNKGLPYVPTPLASNGLLHIWADSGLFHVLDAKTGTPVYEPQRIGGTFFSNPILVGDRIYCGSRDQGEMVVVKAGPEFEILARNDMGAGINATPAVSGGRMFIRTDKHLISVGGSK